jgi:hypothetical protein
MIGGHRVVSDTRWPPRASKRLVSLHFRASTAKLLSYIIVIRGRAMLRTL